MEAEEKLRRDIENLFVPPFSRAWANQKSYQILTLIKGAGYLPVEPAQLEVLGDEEIRQIPFRSIPKDGSVVVFGFQEKYLDYKDVSQATVTHNEEKGQLYRRVE